MSINVNWANSGNNAGNHFLTQDYGRHVSLDTASLTALGLPDDGTKKFGTLVYVLNPSSTTVSLSSLNVTLQYAGADGSTTITTGGTAQNLFAGATPAHGWAIYNPDATNDLWVSDSTTASANGTGSIRIPANGGGYETPGGYLPIGPVSIVGAVTGQKITAKRW